MARQSTRHLSGGDRLRELMRERDMRTEEVAFRLHVSASTVTRWLAGKTEPTPAMGRALGTLFDVDYREFYEREAA